MSARKRRNTSLKKNKNYKAILAKAQNSNISYTESYPEEEDDGDLTSSEFDYTKSDQLITYIYPSENATQFSPSKFKEKGSSKSRRRNKSKSRSASKRKRGGTYRRSRSRGSQGLRKSFQYGDKIELEEYTPGSSMVRSYAPDSEFVDTVYDRMMRQKELFNAKIEAQRIEKIKEELNL